MLSLVLPLHARLVRSLRLALLPTALLAGACASSPTHIEESILIRLHDYKGGARLELASESHSDRVATYSTVRREASLKVQTDEVMAALADELERTGLEQYGQAGRAPSRGSEVVTRALEVDRQGRVTHWVVGPGSPPAELRSFLTAMDDFVQIYNLTQAFQAIENREGTRLFEKEQAATQRGSHPRS